MIQHLFRERDFTHIRGWAGALGTGLPMALGVKLARPNDVVVCVIGDGAFNYNPIPACLGLAQQYNVPVLMIICNNEGYVSQEWNLYKYFPSGYALARQQPIRPGHRAHARLRPHGARIRRAWRMRDRSRPTWSRRSAMASPPCSKASSPYWTSACARDPILRIIFRHSCESRNPGRCPCRLEHYRSTASRPIGDTRRIGSNAARSNAGSRSSTASASSRPANGPMVNPVAPSPLPTNSPSPGPTAPSSGLYTQAHRTEPHARLDNRCCTPTPAPRAAPRANTSACPAAVTR